MDDDENLRLVLSLVLTPHYYFIPTVYITRCVLACLVEVLTTRLSRFLMRILKQVSGLMMRNCCSP